jgi:hypothetical protein
VGLRGKFALYQMNVAFDITTSKLSDTLNSMNGLNDTLNDSLHYMPAGLYIKQHSSNLNIDSSTTTDLDIFINRAGLGVGRPKDKGSIIRGKLTLDSTYDTEANTSLSISLVSNNFTNISSDSAIEIKARDNLGYVALNMKTQNKNKIIPNTWNHLIATWDLNSNSNCKIYINDVESTNLISVDSTSNISYTESFILISGNSGFKGCLSEFWFSNSSINLSNTIIRTQFNGANGNMRPVPLSNVDNTNSNIYTIVYLKANAAFANVNYGKGGDLTFIRSIETCNNSPSDI